MSPLQMSDSKAEFNYSAIQLFQYRVTSIFLNLFEIIGSHCCFVKLGQNRFLYVDIHEQNEPLDPDLIHNEGNEPIVSGKYGDEQIFIRKKYK
ncbi:hypothetical protein I4U23_017449 [Adineta vaga]|nr:hypothetical protein I4U23_017449 [Adineta vaga]